MSGFFNFIKNLFSGLFGFFRRDSKQIEATPSKPKPAKRSGYFLELDEAKGVSNALTQPAEKPASPTVKSAAAAQPAQPAAAVAQPAAAPAKAEAAAKPGPMSSDIKNPASAEVKPDTAKIAQALNLPQPTVTNFATTYMNAANGSGGRRRPGANMSSYLDMAREVRTPG